MAECVGIEWSLPCAPVAVWWGTLLQSCGLESVSSCCPLPHGSALLLSSPFPRLQCVGLAAHSHRLSFKDLSCMNLKAVNRHELFLGFLKQLFDFN